MLANRSDISCILNCFHYQHKTCMLLIQLLEVDCVQDAMNPWFAPYWAVGWIGTRHIRELSLTYPPSKKAVNSTSDDLVRPKDV